MAIDRADLRKCHVLVVDDDVLMQQYLIGELLGKMGIDDIAFADDGADGLACARKRRPDLVILDLEMPRMDGIEMLGHLRSDPSLAQVPVIVQTSLDSSESRYRVFKAGASDFVTKPLNNAEFEGRVKVHLQNEMLVRQLQDQLGRVADELAEAAKVQRHLLPSPASLRKLSERMGLRVEHCFDPCSALGGDLWDIIPISDQAVAFYICDFSGHGVGAALQTVRLHTMISQLPPPCPGDPASFVSQLNEGLCSVLSLRNFATFLLVVIDLGSGTMSYSAAGAPDPLLGSPLGEIVFLDGMGLPLGLRSDACYRNKTLEFPPGSFLFLHSDAISESCGPDGALIGGKGAEAMVQQALAETGRDGPIVEHILNSFKRMAPGRIEDDLTAIWIERIR
jgi:phosphoserine phosphatase RsbU/P